MDSDIRQSCLRKSNLIVSVDFSMSPLSVLNTGLDPIPEFNCQQELGLLIIHDFCESFCCSFGKVLFFLLRQQ